ncbi:hypothetical protein B0A54_03294 [Friedmanniomyces endolithicus]|uniref:Uncharacterized protein n=1 Tax=Friedmanniomyces endolithicus TaxID=329885 RepID=A0A4U0V965_9PEZI|nr:hypothetical protein B0A54_03294 [Friedmanniomyces endolithicus]
MPKASSTPVNHSKPCTLCHTPRDVLIRCQIDSTCVWHFVCPGSCWKSVSGGVVDGDGDEAHKWYRYGGMWKNKHEAVSAKMRKPKARRKAGGKVGEGSEGLAVKGGEDSEVSGGEGPGRDGEGHEVEPSREEGVET